MNTHHQRLVVTSDGRIRPPDGTEDEHTFMVAPTGDGEFRAACSCGWESFGTYARVRAPQLRTMHTAHLSTT